MTETLLTYNNPIKERVGRAKPPRAGLGFLGVALLLACYLAIVAAAIASLEQLAGHPIAGQLPGRALRPLGLWLPARLADALARFLPFVDRADLTFHVLVIVLFVLYLALLWLSWRLATTAGRRRGVLWLVGGVLLVSGGILVVAPGMLSHDIFVYAGYGRVMVAHGANPYFVPLSAFPGDPLTSLDDWKTAVAAYGPLWLMVCAALSWLLGGNAPAYVLAFRLLALGAHLLNMGLIVRLLRALGRSQRVITLGAVLYGLNPLMLIESALGAHNDVLMMTCLLLGCCCADPEGRRLERVRYWLPALVAMLLAVLIKFTALLGVLLFLCLLLFRTLQRDGSRQLLLALRLRWRPALTRLLLALGCMVLLVGLAYLPFWLGHSLHDIVVSLLAPPSTSRDLGQFSILRAIQEWRYYHRQPLGAGQADARPLRTAKYLESAAGAGPADGSGSGPVAALGATAARALGAGGAADDGGNLSGDSLVFPLVPGLACRVGSARLAGTWKLSSAGVCFTSLCAGFLPLGLCRLFLSWLHAGGWWLDWLDGPQRCCPSASGLWADLAGRLVVGPTAGHSRWFPATPVRLLKLS